MNIINTAKCLFIYFSLTYRKNLVDSTDTSATHNPGAGTQGGTAVTTTAGATETATKIGIGLSIGSGFSTDNFQCNKNGLRRTYTPKGNNSFNLVSQLIGIEWVKIWSETDSKKFSNKVEVDLMNGQPKSVTIYLPDNKTKVFMKESIKGWTEIDTSKVYAKSINIKYEHSSYIYENELKNNVRTFTAKPGFAFKLVYEFIDQKNRPEIWKTDQANEYSMKVEAEGGNKVTIYIGNDGSTMVFTKGTDGKWTEDTGSSKKGSTTDGSGGVSSPESKPAIQ